MSRKSAPTQEPEVISTLDPNRASAPKQRQRSPRQVAAAAHAKAGDELDRITARIAKLKDELAAMETAHAEATKEHSETLAALTNLNTTP